MGSRSEHGRRLYPSWWDHQRHIQVRMREAVGRAVNRYARLAAGQRVVDMGCGGRPYETLFRRLGCDYIGCDIDGEPDVRIVPGQAVPLSDGSFDGVVSNQVLEHVWDLDWYLGECRRLLKPGGWLLLSTHGNWLYHPHPTDYRRWTRDGLVRELQERGFTSEHVEGVVGPLAWTTQFRLLGLRYALRAVPYLGPVLLIPLTCFMNLRMALEDIMTPSSITDVNACVYVVMARALSM